jgi:hypothetical protein
MVWFLLGCAMDSGVVSLRSHGSDDDVGASASEASPAPPDNFGEGGSGEPEPAPAPGCESFEPGVVVGALAPGLDEVSGLAASRRQPGVLWAIEDSGNAPVLYALDIDGSVLAEVPVAAPNVDWEDLAIAPCGDTDCLWIADVGDNDLVRSDARLLIIAEPDVSRGGRLPQVTPETMAVRYADGPHNVEALVVSAEGEPLLFSKQDDGHSLLLAPLADQFGVIATVETAGRGDSARDARLTAADLWRGDTELLLRTYRRAWRISLGDAELAAAGEIAPEPLDVVDQEQVEAVAWDAAIRGWWQTSEGEGAALIWTGCAEP